MADIVVQFEGTVYENGYGQIAKKVMTDKTLHIYAKAIYSYLVSFAGSKDESFPSVSRMMQDLGIKSEDTLYKYRNQLVKAGYITIKHGERLQGKFYNNIYKINTIPTPIAEKEPYPTKSGMVSPYPISSSTVTSSTVKSSTNNNNLSIKTNSNKNIKKQQQGPSVVIFDTSQKSAIQKELHGIGIKVEEKEMDNWLKKHELGYILEKITILHNAKDKPSLRALRAAIRDDWQRNDTEVSPVKKSASERQYGSQLVSSPIVQPDKYEKFYKLYEKAKNKDNFN